MASEPTGSRSTAVDAVVAAIIEGIKHGRYVPGQRLVESDLTGELGVSRGPLREAFGRLAAEGLLQIEPYRGALVRRMTREDVVDLFEVREVLEGQAAALAATRIHVAGNRAALQAVLARMRHHESSDIVGYMDVNERFHEVIVELSGNRTLARLVGQLQVQAFRLFYRRLADAAARERSVSDHEAVAAAILAADPAAAEQAMRAHVRTSTQAALQVWDPVPALHRT
jgi:DNA-binding GntR family transcriptional regulator